MRNVRVELGAASYDIAIGISLADQLREFLKQHIFSGKALVVSDRAVAALYGARVLAVLREAGVEAEVLAVEPGEASKSLAVADRVYTRAIELGLDRKSAVFALGGGVVGDLTGFVAATFLRGVPFVQLPTSLLAQVDSSVGGKVAVNHPLGKNLIGAFYQPKGVLMDLATLDTLPPREIYTGLAEVVKYGVIADAEFFAYLEENAASVLALDKEAAAHIVARSCELKAEVVGEDEKEMGRRVILNFGHTIAHTIETATGYAKYTHGEAVAVGMRGAAFLSRALGLTGGAEVERLEKLIAAFHLPLKAEGCTAEQLFPLLSRDKKTVGGKTNWVLMNGIGSVTVTSDVPDTAIRQALEMVTS